ncbi:MAG: hypothetical protein MJ098_03490 [Saccharofermentans sp.]|nr:hypothetical protein [Saccharofermentans sp.]
MKKADAAAYMSSKIVALAKFSLNDLKYSLKTDGLSPASIEIVILYKAVIEAPIVKTGIHVKINNKLTMIKLQRPVRNLVAAPLGLKKEEAISIPHFPYIIDKEIITH